MNPIDKSLNEAIKEIQKKIEKKEELELDENQQTELAALKFALTYLQDNYIDRYFIRESSIPHVHKTIVMAALEQIQEKLENYDIKRVYRTPKIFETEVSLFVPANPMPRSLYSSHLKR